MWNITYDYNIHNPFFVHDSLSLGLFFFLAWRTITQHMQIYVYSYKCICQKYHKYYIIIILYSISDDNPIVLLLCFHMQISRFGICISLNIILLCHPSNSDVNRTIPIDGSEVAHKWFCQQRPSPPLQWLFFFFGISIIQHTTQLFCYHAAATAYSCRDIYVYCMDCTLECNFSSGCSLTVDTHTDTGANETKQTTENDILKLFNYALHKTIYYSNFDNYSSLKSALARLVLLSFIHLYLYYCYHYYHCIVASVIFAMCASHHGQFEANYKIR